MFESTLLCLGLFPEPGDSAGKRQQCVFNIRCLVRGHCSFKCQHADGWRGAVRVRVVMIAERKLSVCFFVLLLPPSKHTAPCGIERQGMCVCLPACV